MSFPPDLLRRCWFLAGPTACGKTAASLILAEKIDAEIIALDAMTLYRAMDIGTAKPTLEERSRVRHHLIDLLEPQQEFSLAEYLAVAETACQEVISRRKIPLFVGGTGLYLRGILRGLFEGPAADLKLRDHFEEQARRDGSQSLHDQLRRVDPISADRLHPNDQRRVIRALEVFELTGQPLSALQDHGPRPVDERPRHVYWLSPPRDWLYRRIDARVELMIAGGLVDEVRQLLERPEPLSRTASQALGYKEVIDWIHRQDQDSHAAIPQGQSGPATLQEVVTLIQTRTRQFAKRQHTWFRNLEECRSISILGHENSEEIADRIVNEANQSFPAKIRTGHLPGC